jgi:hypothetical protein
MGIQPQVMALGLELSELIQEKLEILVARIISELRGCGIEYNRRH